MHSVAWHHVVAVLFRNFWQLLCPFFEWWPWPRQHFYHGRHDSWDAWWQLGCYWQLSAVCIAIVKILDRLICSGEVIRNMRDTPRSYVASPFILLTLKWDGGTAFSWAVPFIPCWKLGIEQYLYPFIDFNRCTIRKGLLPSCAETSGRTCQPFCLLGRSEVFCQFQFLTLPSLDFWIIKPPNSGSLRWESCWKLRGDALYSCFTSWCMI